MGQSPATIYDPVTDRLVTADEMSALMKEREGQEFGELAIKGGPDQSVGFKMPPMAQDDASGILKAFPQIAGLIAQFTPAGRGVMGSMAVPSITELLRQLVEGEDPDLSKAATQGAVGTAAHGVGRVISEVGNAGRGLVKGALNIREPFANRTGESYLPDAALKEKVSMTIPGADKLKAKAQATASGGLEDLFEVLERARLDNSLSSNLHGGVSTSVLQEIFTPPRQMGIGQALARPFGVDTAKTTAPSIEAGVRALMAWLSSQMGGGSVDPPLGDSGGAQRKPLR